MSSSAQLASMFPVLMVNGTNGIRLLGWSAYATPEITWADLLAYDLYEAAKKHLAGQKISLFGGPKEPDFESNLYILKHTKCPADIPVWLNGSRERPLWAPQ